MYHKGLPLRDLGGKPPRRPCRKSLVIRHLSTKKNAFTSHFMLAISYKPVIIICMRIEKDFTNNDDNDDIFSESDISANKAMDAVTDILGDWFIVPALASGELDEEQQEVLVHIKFALNIIAKKAQAWEDLQYGITKNKNSKN